jgi:hypothetical protein
LRYSFLFRAIANVEQSAKLTWAPATIDEVVALLAEGIEGLHPRHKEQLSPYLVTPRQVPVDDMPGETVVVVAEIDQRILYFSDVDDGWELECPSETGGIGSRGCNQYELSHVMYQEFGDPDA